ncbi:LPS translocon maturation chaperone LptM [Candidatus Enterovibrio escicola]|uniref:Lipoprotein n=2 Tax=Candidatus Enterovibrio escicola TaxID=1927127 RepID=A0A2A5SZ88_9GAMM|nr:hypothetical protein [Candidatus Enterovibrio escacola]PCS21178.1 hypothetical protein BTN49_3328 [Candidatus Enterovibrio escacola]
MLMKRAILKPVVLVITTVISACGQQGQLYFPKEEAAENNLPITLKVLQDTQLQPTSQP